MYCFQQHLFILSGSSVHVTSFIFSSANWPGQLRWVSSILADLAASAMNFMLSHIESMAFVPLAHPKHYVKLLTNWKDILDWDHKLIFLTPPVLANYSDSLRKEDCGVPVIWYFLFT